MLPQAELRLMRDIELLPMQPYFSEFPQHHCHPRPDCRQGNGQPESRGEGGVSAGQGATSRSANFPPSTRPTRLTSRVILLHSGKYRRQDAALEHAVGEVALSGISMRGDHQPRPNLTQIARKDGKG